MSINTHLAELNEKHRSLEKRIADEMSHPAANSQKIAAWKQEKLKLKDEIAKLSDSSGPEYRH
jgi:hypothetical protein